MSWSPTEPGTLDEPVPEKPVDLGVHEVLHMTGFFMNSVHSELAEHSSIASHPEWSKLVDQIHDKLWELYQAIGKEHL